MNTHIKYLLNIGKLKFYKVWGINTHSDEINLIIFMYYIYVKNQIYYYILYNT